MKLKRLIIQGFKSFKDRTTINFDDGITGIVGPNGCGKSNIVDALFWIMGEQSAKHLRGNSMKDVIFAGSSKYAPASWAEATLVLENTAGKHIHIGNRVANPTEIQLTRKLYRNGESEYRINDEPCRLKDVQEVFMDTGAGAKSYSIIAQGEINKLVQQKPEERRVMIEEVAGITKFKLRKRESLKKIEHTQTNLNRLQDLTDEIEKNLQSLQKQAEKAEKARSLKERVQKYDLVVHAHKVHDYLKDLREARTFLNEARINLENWKLEKSNLEISLSEERLQRDLETEKLDDHQDEYNVLSKKLAADEERLNYLCKSLSEKEMAVDQRQKEKEDLEADLAERLAKKESFESQLIEIEQSKSTHVDFSDLEEKVEFLKSALEERSDTLTEIKRELATAQEQLVSKENELYRTNSKLDEIAKNLEDVGKEIDDLEKEHAGVNDMLVREREEVAQLEHDLQAQELSEKAAKAELEGITASRGELDKKLKSQQSSLLKIETTLNSLRELNQNREGSSEGLKAFLAAYPDAGFQTLEEQVQTIEGYEKVVQSLLSHLGSSLIGPETSADFYQFIQKNPEAAVSLINAVEVDPSRFAANEELIERLKLKGFTGIKALAEVLVCDEGLKQKICSWAGQAYIVENLSAANIELLADLRVDRIIAKSGALAYVRESGLSLIQNGHTANDSGVIERNNRINQLDGEFNQGQEVLRQLEAEWTQITSAWEQKTAAYAALRETVLAIKEKYIAKKSAFESKGQSFSSFNNRLTILKSRKSDYSKSRLELFELQDKLSKLVERLQSETAEKKNAAEESEETIRELQSQYESNKDELLSKKAEASSWDERIKNTRGQIADLTGQLEKMNLRKDNIDKMLETFAAEMATIEQDTKILEEQNLKTAADLAEKEEFLSLMKDRLAELLIGMQERENKVRELSTRINKTDKEIVEQELKAQKFIEEEAQITRDIFEKYRIDLRKVLCTFLEMKADEYGLVDLTSMYFIETENGTKELEAEDYEFSRRYGQDLRDCSDKLKGARLELSRLGDINWQAIEDYERQKMRYDFLKIQEVELKKSLEDLQAAIEKIDNKSKERFKYAFDEVNQRFMKVFPIIFGGGSAHLNVVGNLDDPECGVDIVAQPPGKKMQNINLMSGGEKALTAVSLIFSIFLVKPSPFCLLDEVDAPLDDANVGRFNELLREMSKDSQFILITHNKKTMELNDTLYGVTMQEPGISKAVSVQLH